MNALQCSFFSILRVWQGWVCSYQYLFQTHVPSIYIHVETTACYEYMDRLICEIKIDSFFTSTMCSSDSMLTSVWRGWKMSMLIFQSLCDKKEITHLCYHEYSRAWSLPSSSTFKKRLRAHFHLKPGGPSTALMTSLPPFEPITFLALWKP